MFFCFFIHSSFLFSFSEKHHTHPPAAMWAQRKDKIYLTLNLEDCKDPKIQLTETQLTFRLIHFFRRVPKNCFTDKLYVFACRYLFALLHDIPNKTDMDTNWSWEVTNSTKWITILESPQVLNEFISGLAISFQTTWPIGQFFNDTWQESDGL